MTEQRYLPNGCGLFLWMFIVLLCAGSIVQLHAQTDAPGDPSGSSGDFDGLSTTGSGYDTYTGNSKRMITDVVVPSTAGTIPLSFARIYNARVNVTPTPIGAHFGDANWRHNFQWEGQITTTNGVTVYQVGYPDGRVINFQMNRAHQITDVFARGPAPTADRFDPTADSNGQYHLHLADGSQAVFSLQLDSNGNHTLLRAEALIDPFQAITRLFYTTYTTTVGNQTVQVLNKIREPGGRYLYLSYDTKSFLSTANNTQYYWAVIAGVSWNDSTGQAHNDAIYQYSTYGPGAPDEAGLTTIYCGLKSVVYSQLLRGSLSSHVTASYTYQAVNNPGSLATAPPLLLTANDPFFAGPMHQIEYVYASGAGVWGLVSQERNPSNHVMVSSLTQDQPNTPNTATESRGDYTDYNKNQHVTRSFQYGQIWAGSIPSNARQFQVTTATDFQGHAAYTSYNPKDSSRGWGYVAQVIDAAGTSTAYVTEPFAGKVTQVTLPGGRSRKMTWAGVDPSTGYSQLTANYPYFVTSTTDERNQTTNYYRHANTGYIEHILYPDGTTETFTYTPPFSGPNGPYYKISDYYNKSGAHFSFAYGQNDNGQGPADLLKSVTRTYTDGLTPAGSHSETIYYGYDSSNRVSFVKDGRGIIENFLYNPRGQVVHVTHGVFSQQDQPDFDFNHKDIYYDYDDDGNCIGVTDELGHTTTVTYDSYRRVTNVSVPVNAPQANGSLVGSRFRGFSYTRRDTSQRSMGNAVTDTASDWSLSWLPSGAAVARVFSLNYWLTDDYDGMHVDVSQNSGVPTPGNGAMHSGITYNALGQPLSTINGDPFPNSDGHHFATTYTYDSSNRPSTATDPLGGQNHTLTRTYYANGESASNNSGVNCTGLLKSLTVPGPDLANVPTAQTQYTSYDQMGRLKSSLDPSNHTFNSGYDAAGNLATQDDGGQASGGHSTAYARDQLGRKSQVNYPDNTTEQWKYDQSGNVSTFKNRANVTCTYSYTDGRNRCTGYSWSDGSTLGCSYSYFANGLLKEAKNTNADVVYAYDESNALISEKELITGLNWKATQYTHDQDGNVDSITYPNGNNKPCFYHDDQERVTNMYSGSTVYSAYNYSGDRLTDRTLYNRVYTHFDYQNNGRVWDVWHVHNDTGQNIRRSCYGYAPDGQISWFDREGDGWSSGSALENGRGEVYYYYPDGSVGVAARDVAAKGGWPALYSYTQDSRVSEGNIDYSNGSANTYCNNYFYDAAGNRTQASQMNQGTIPYYDNTKNENQYAGSAYDGNGNTTNSAVGWAYAYDAENKMTTAWDGSGHTIQFYYDAAGRMVEQIDTGVASYFTYAGAQRIEEYDASKNLHYVYCYEAPGSDRILFRQGGPWGRLWYQTDLMGNTTHLSAETVNAQGQLTGVVVEQYLYDAYGTPTVYNAAGVQLGVSSYDNRYLFKSSGGYVWNSQAGMYYCRARFYLPQHGRFLQPDPIGQAGGLNVYGYCHNDPINNVDASGLNYILAIPIYEFNFDTDELEVAGYNYILVITSTPGVVSSGGSGNGGNSGNDGKSGRTGGTLPNGGAPPTPPPPPTPHLVQRGENVFGAVSSSMVRSGPLPADTFNQVPKYLGYEVGGGFIIEAAAVDIWITARGTLTRVATNVYARIIAAIYGASHIPGVEQTLEEDFGGGTTFTHFTDVVGVEGITGVENLLAGETVTLGQITFGNGANTFLATNPGDIFLTDLEYTATSGALNQIGVFAARQAYAISFSQETLFNNGVRAVFVKNGIYTIPGNITLEGVFKLYRNF